MMHWVHTKGNTILSGVTSANAVYKVICTIAWQWQRQLLLLSLLCLTACAPTFTKPTPEQQAAWERHTAQLVSLDTWQLNAQFAIASEAEAWSARVYWQQQADAYALRFTAPLGQGVLRLQGDAEGVLLRTAQQDTLYADSPEALLYQATALDIPISHLYFWVRGLPAPDDDKARYGLDAQGRLKRLQQAGWTLEYASYSEVMTFTLPRKLFLQNAEFHGKIVISEWML